jgi:transcriptional regulator with XRE-family HTH domain
MSANDRLREARAYLALPLPYLAAESGVEAETIEEFERGEREPTELQLRRLGRVLGYPIAYFLGETDALTPDGLQAVARWADELEDVDRDQALRFAQFLQYAAQSEADAAS